MAALTRDANRELLDLPDCRALLENGKCRRRGHLDCLGSACAYIQEQDRRENAQQRLCSLNEETQAHIADKYYGGARPWVQAKTPDGRK